MKASWLLCAVLLTACPTEDPMTTNDLPPSAASSSATVTATPTATTEAPAPTPKDMAAAVVDAMMKGDFDSVVAKFDADMAKALSKDQLAAGWAASVSQFGQPGQRLGFHEQKADKYLVVIVTQAFDVLPVDVRVVFNDKNQISGLLMRPSDFAFASRPQTPKAPFDYESRDVSYSNPKDNSTIAGTLTLPKGAGPHPAVILITGSGSQDRDETLFGHKPFFVIADQLTKQGIAVLRVDDRGVGKSTGDPKNATIEIHATDVQAGLAFLKTQKEIDPKRMGLIGHSEGGIIAAVVAKQSTDVAFVVSLAGTGLPGAEINPMQIEAIMRAKGVPAESIKSVVDDQRKLMKLIARDASEKEIDKALQEAVDNAPGGAKADPKAVAAKIASERAMVLSPWFKSFVKLDPAAYWSKVKVPVLALVGEKDVQVPADANLEAISKALAKGGNKVSTTQKVAGVNHLFQTCKTGLVEEYGTIEETIAPSALELMTTWLKQRAGLTK